MTNPPPEHYNFDIENKSQQQIYSLRQELKSEQVNYNFKKQIICQIEIIIKKIKVDKDDTEIEKLITKLKLRRSQKQQVKFIFKKDTFGFIN